MNVEEAKQYLNTFINFEHNLNDLSSREFKLDRMYSLLNFLNNPQKDLKIIHVAGSKGKGSTCAMIASILKEAGLSVGLYTSPHIYNYRERIRIVQKSSYKSHWRDLFEGMIQEEHLAQLLDEMKPAIEQVKEQAVDNYVSFFEVFTAMAFLYFKKRNVDYVVLETGLGGRLDATNTAASRVCVLTSISLEHMHILGDTVEKIAAEKAAIIKSPSQRVVFANKENSVTEIIKKRCEEFDITPMVVHEDIKIDLVSQDEKIIANVQYPDKQMHHVELPLIGLYQVENMGLALAAIECLSDKLHFSEEVIRRGLRSVKWPARMEIINRKPLTILDSAHNGDSAKTLAASIKYLYPDKNVNLLIGICNDKDEKEFCREVNTIANRVYCTSSKHPRARKFTSQEIDRLFPTKEFVLTENVDQALKFIQEEDIEDDVLLVTGSIFLVSEVRDHVSV